MIDAGAAWSIDIEMYVRSSLIRSYNPIHEFLADCGKWDRKRDHIGELARRVPNNYGDILSEQKNLSTGKDKPTMRLLTQALKASKYLYGAQDGVRGWYAKRKE